MLNKDYSIYKFEDFLEDDDFVMSILYPTEKQKLFWENMLKEGRVDADAYHDAVTFVRTLRNLPQSKMTSEESEALWNRIHTDVVVNRWHSFKIFVRSVAAVLLLAVAYIAVSIFTKPEIQDIRQVASASESLENTLSVQLILSNAEKIVLDDDFVDVECSERSVKIVSGSQDASKSSKTCMIPEKTSDFNRLIVPNGKRSILLLADGTKIWVNSGTTVVFPSAFAKKKREIYIDGEAFLEVSKDPKRPFVVKTKRLDVSVLGTSFNLLSYSEDASESITLVEGSVAVNTSEKEKPHVLKPNEMLTTKGSDCSVQMVDVQNHISWKNGIYKYESESLSMILKRLARHYGVDILCNQDFSSIRCSGKLDMRKDLESLFKGLSMTAPIFYIKNN